MTRQMQRTVFLLLLAPLLVFHAYGQIRVSPNTERILGLFKNGYAQIREGNSVYHINRKGEIFDIRNPNNVHWGLEQTVETYETELLDNAERLPRQVTLLGQKGLFGVLDPKGNMLLDMAYDQIDIQHGQFWRLYKDNKQSLYLPDGTILPFFDEIGYLDGEYFDVKQGNSWSIYSKSQNKIITVQTYEAFDYCGGCGRHALYAYAKKKGKWGIVDWQENVLVPFEFDHIHSRMRSDEWVASFSKNNKSVIVHIPTQQIFYEEDGYQLASGMLIATQDGKYGAYNRKGELAIPFEYDKIDVPNQNYFSEYYGNYLIIEKNKQKGLAHTDGNIIAAPEYDNIMVYDDYYVLSKQNQSSLYHLGGDEALLTVDNGEIFHVNDYFHSSGSHGLEIFTIRQKAFVGLYFAKTKRYYEPAYYNASIANRRHFPDQDVIMADRQGALTYLDLEGNVIFPFEVQKIEFPDGIRDGSIVTYQSHGKSGIFDIAERKEIIPAQYDNFFKILGDTEHYLIRCSDNSYSLDAEYDLYNTSGHKINKQPITEIEEIDKQFFLVQHKDGQYALLDVQRQELEALPYSHVSLAGSPQLLLVSKNGKEAKLYHIFQKKEMGNITFRPRRYTRLAVDLLEPAENAWILMDFKYGLGEVQGPKGYGLIDEQGEVLIQPQYAQLHIYDPKHIFVGQRDDYSYTVLNYFVNKKGERIFPEGYYADEMLAYNMLPQDLGDKVILMKSNRDNIYFGLGDLNKGEVIIPADYLNIRPIPDYPYFILEARSKQGSWSRLFGLADSDGKILFEPKFEDMVYPRSVSIPSEDIRTEPIFPLLVKEEGTWRYVNEDGTYLPIEGKGAEGTGWF